jgi:hypothetical protein
MSLHKENLGLARLFVDQLPDCQNERASCCSLLFTWLNFAIGNRKNIKSQPDIIHGLMMAGVKLLDYLSKLGLNLLVGMGTIWFKPSHLTGWISANVSDLRFACNGFEKFIG